MTINTLPATFAGYSLDIIVIGNERWVRSSQIGYALGFTFVRQGMDKIYKRNAAEFGLDDSMMVEVPTDGGMQLTRLYSAKGIAKIAMLANTPKAAAFRDWAAGALTTPEPAPEPAPELLLSQPVIGATAMAELRTAWLAQSKNRPFVKYAKLGLSNPEIALLCGWKTSAVVTKKRRTAEALGLIEPSPKLNAMRLTAQSRQFGAANGIHPVTRHLELQRAKQVAS